MTPLRHLIRTHRRLVALLCVVAIAVRLLVPTGYMLAREGGGIAVTLCPQVVAAADTAMPAMAGMHHGQAKKHGAAEMPCPFAALSLPSLGAVDPVLLAIALAIVAALALLSPPPLPVRTALRLRPPLRGPPRPA